MVRGEGDRLIVSGPVNIDTAPDLVGPGSDLVRGGVRIVDLAGATELDSATISLVLEWQRVGKGGLKVAAAPAAFVKLAKLYGVADLLPAA